VGRTREEWAAGVDMDKQGMEQQAKRTQGEPAGQHATGLGDAQRPLRRRADVLLAGQREAYELLLAGAALAPALEVLMRTLEVQSEQGLLASAWLLGDEGGLLACARGSLPAACWDALQAQPLSQAGPFAEAVQNKATAAASLDAAHNDDTAGRVLQAHGLRWQTVVPVLSPGRELLGLCVLHAARSQPLGEADLLAAQEAAHSAALLVEHDQRRLAREREAHRHATALATLAHDLRNPLAPLRNTIELLNRMGPDPVMLERATSIMTRQINQIARLTEDLSELAHGLPQQVLALEASATPAEDRQLSLPDVAFAPDTGACKVLVADDNELVRDSFVELLRAEGYDVRTAVDGVQAVELADQWRPQAVLLDIHMPRLSGLETARRLRAAHPPQQMALLMMSGMTLNDAWLRHAKAAGFDDCVDKTSDPKHWLGRLRQALPRH